MLITNIKLRNFRNYKEINLELENGINIFYGDNAQGKTNIIEAVYLSAIGKSFRTNKDNELINFNEKYTEINIDYKKKYRDGKIKIEISDKKNIFVNGVKIKKLSELLGNVNIVIFTPDDINILKNGPANRRRFLDMLIGQLRPNYIHILNNYNKVLEQRNNYLKQIKFEKKPESLIEIWDEKLAEFGERIYEYRNEFFEKIKSKISQIHNDITEGNEKIALEYISNCKNKSNFLVELKQSRKIDINKGYTNKGVHRDDFVIYINETLVNVYGSQGQHRTAMLSLKKAELEVIKEEIGEYPILLLDDFMSELDEKRRHNFLEGIENIQVIITCTDKIKSDNIEYRINNVINGKIIND